MKKVVFQKTSKKRKPIELKFDAKSVHESLKKNLEKRTTKVT